MPIVVPPTVSEGIVIPGFIAPSGSVSGDGQYEFNGLVMNDGANGNVQVISSEGLYELPEFKSVDYEQLDDDGGVISLDLLSMRTIVLDLAVRAATEAILQLKLQQIRYAFQPQTQDKLLTFQRPGLGPRQIWARPRKCGGFHSDYHMAHGLAFGSVMLKASDPRVLGVDQQLDTLTIASSATTTSKTLVQQGNFVKGAWPVLEIDGPATNVRISNANDENRSIKVDMVINAGQTLILDTRRRTATIGGVNQYANVRPDNQWWRLLPGNNLITFTRTSPPASTSTLRVKWFTTWI